MSKESKFYVPILKWKRGEQKAIEHLDSSIKDKLLPLIEIPPIDFDWNNGVPKKTIDQHIATIPDTIASSFGSNEVFVDILNIDEEDMLSDGTHSIEYIVNTSINLNVNIIPVVGSNRSTEYITAIQNLLASNTINKLCIRIETSDFNTINPMLNSMLDLYSVSRNQCHLIIDLKEITSAIMPSYEMLVPVIVNNIINLSDWLSITLSSTAFPKTLEQVQKNSFRLLPRYEFRLWNNLINSSQLSCDLQFGDYCIANPEYSDIDPRFMGMSGNIRYTISDNFLVYKGVNAKTNGFSQMTSMCRQLIASPHYSGQSFSWGDEYIYNCANNIASTGNAETWRRVGTNHHIVFIVDQLSNLSYF